MSALTISKTSIADSCRLDFLPPEESKSCQVVLKEVHPDRTNRTV